MTIGQRTHFLRYSLGLSSAQLARKAGISRTALWMLETGKVHHPRAFIARKVATALGVEVGQLLGLGDHAAEFDLELEKRAFEAATASGPAIEPTEVEDGQ
jgi:transcriptional regulator with XRE-family HTH domain